MPTTSGFTARFDGAIHVDSLNLYSTEGALGLPDVRLHGARHGPVRGSLIVDSEAQSVEFVKTGGILEPDTYTVTLRSASEGFRSATGSLLDAGSDFVTTFTVDESSAVVVSLPDVVRGLLKHFTVYGTGRRPAVAEAAEIERIAGELAADGYRLRDLLKAVLRSKIFLGNADKPVRVSLGLPD